MSENLSDRLRNGWAGRHSIELQLYRSEEVAWAYKRFAIPGGPHCAAEAKCGEYILQLWLPNGISGEMEIQSLEALLQKNRTALKFLIGHPLRGALRQENRRRIQEATESPLVSVSGIDQLYETVWVPSDQIWPVVAVWACERDDASVRGLITNVSEVPAITPGTESVTCHSWPCLISMISDVVEAAIAGRQFSLPSGDSGQEDESSGDSGEAEQGHGDAGEPAEIDDVLEEKREGPSALAEVDKTPSDSGEKTESFGDSGQTDKDSIDSRQEVENSGEFGEADKIDDSKEKPTLGDVAAISTGPELKEAEQIEQFKNKILLPSWDLPHSTISFEGIVVRQFGAKVGESVKRILSAFEEEHWPEHILDPITGPNEDKSQVTEALRTINRGLSRLSFHVNGEYIVWRRK